MIPVKESQNEQWDIFENAATHSYARSVLEKSKNNLTTNENKSRSTISANEYVDKIRNNNLNSSLILVLK